MAEFLLVDGPGFLWRAFHAVPPRHRADGLPVNAVEGVISMLLRPLVERNVSSHVGVFFESTGPTFRHHLYPGYKANRPPPPADLVRQIPVVRAAVRAYGFVDLDVEGFEADDLIATVASRARMKGHKVIIVSSDKDLMQLVGPGVEMFDQQKKAVLREKEVVAKFGVGPQRVIDVQALAGDTTDGVPGVPGIGLKTAAELVSAFGDVEQILGSLGLIGNRRWRNLLEKHGDDARLSRTLVTLRRDAPLAMDLEAFRVPPPSSQSRAFLDEYALPAYLAPRASRRHPDWRERQAA